MNNYTYAQLGSTCETSMHTLTSNKKFIPLNYVFKKKNNEIKIKEYNKNRENVKPVVEKCCGR